MSYKTDLAYPKCSLEGPREAFMEYLKDQHQQFLETNQGLEHKVQLLEKSMVHLQARIKLKDSEIMDKTEQTNRQTLELEELRAWNQQLSLKNKALKKQGAKFQTEIRQLEEDVQEERLVSIGLQNERMTLLQKPHAGRSASDPAEAEFLKLKNLELEREVAKAREREDKLRADLALKESQFQEMHIIIEKVSEEMDKKNHLHDQLQIKYQILQRSHLDFLSKAQDPYTNTKISLKFPAPQNQSHSHSNSTSRNKSISLQASHIRKAGGIRVRNSQEESHTYQSVSDVGQMSRERENRSDNVRKEDFLQNLISRFQRLKHGSVSDGFS